jgi:hypothetical protein
MVQRMYEMRCRHIDDQVDRFEVIANYLSHTDQRCLDFQAIAEDSGYSDSSLRDTVRRIGTKLKLVERTTDLEGAWYSLKVDPFSRPDDAPDEEKREVPETQMERLYRECCDDANAEIRKTVLKLDELRSKVQPAVGSLVTDLVVDLSRVSILLTQISAAGVKGDRESYIKGLRERVQRILKGETS